MTYIKCLHHLCYIILLLCLCLSYHGSAGATDTTVEQGVTGEPGLKGPSGETGVTGPPGPKGYSGATGSTGPRGNKGPKGGEGTVGPKGEQGDCCIGLNGEQAHTVQTDANSIAAQQGVAGPPGRTGATGIYGPTGATGATGQIGPTGESGRKGDKGSIGPNGEKGDSCISSKGDEGGKGQTEPIGPKGANTIAAQQGVIGPPGSTGDTGRPGLTGESGATGPSGQTGQPGFTGPTGRKGNKGTIGPKGEKGDCCICPTGQQNEIYIVEISPLYGPVAGGTNISITLRCPLSGCGIVTLYIGDNPCQQLHQIRTNNLHTYTFQSMTLLMNDSTTLPLRLYSGHIPLVPEHRFTYKPNPTVSKMQPLSALITGGILLTVYGENLDSVQTAILLVNVVKNDSSSVVVQQLQSTCRQGEYSTTTCPTPVINITKKPDADTETRRIVRDTEEERSISIKGYVFYLGLIFDGYDEYEDIDDYKLDVIVDTPMLDGWKEVRYHEHGELLGIEGSNLLTGCTADDYTIWTGNVTCDNVDVTQNVLECQPPVDQPDHQSDGHIIAGAVQVVVFIGYYKNLIGHLSYDDEEGGLSRAAMIGLIVGCSLLGLIIILLIVAYCVYHRKQKENTGNENSRQTTNLPSELVHMPPLEGGD